MGEIILVSKIEWSQNKKWEKNVGRIGWDGMGVSMITTMNVVFEISKHSVGIKHCGCWCGPGFVGQ